MSESDKDNDLSSTTGSAISIPPLLDGSDAGASTDAVDGLYKYRDFSKIAEDEDEVADVPPPAPTTRGNMESSIRVQKFPVKLYAILAQKEFHEIIAWMPHGRAWKVLKPSVFESMVMPLFFEYSNYHSFNRLVNAWSFRRMGSGPDRGSYYHELFLRGKPHLQKYMRRLPKTQKKQPMKKRDEPDFYAMDKEKPLPALEDAPIPGLASSMRSSGGGAFLNKANAFPSTMGMNQDPSLVTPQRGGRMDNMATPSQRILPGGPSPMYSGGSCMYPEADDFDTMPLPADFRGPMYQPMGNAFGGPPPGMRMRNGPMMAQQPQAYRTSPMEGMPHPEQGMRGTFGDDDFFYQQQQQQQHHQQQQQFQRRKHFQQQQQQHQQQQRMQMSGFVGNGPQGMMGGGGGGPPPMMSQEDFMMQHMGPPARVSRPLS